MNLLLLLLGATALVPQVLADRGNAPNVPPTACNNAPLIFGDPSPLPTNAPSCSYASDLSGGMGLCPNLSNGGWCDCGSAGNYPPLIAANPCGYASFNPQATISLSSTNCVNTEAPAERDGGTPPQVKREEQTWTTMTKREEPTSTPVVAPRLVNALQKRGGQITFSNCNGAPPLGSGYGPVTGFTTMQSVIQAAYNDAVTLATYAANHAQSTDRGFTNYFGGEKADVQITHFQALMKAISDTSTSYSIQFECQNTQQCGEGSFMATDFSSGSPMDVKKIVVCPLFWTEASTKYLLYNSAHQSPTPPYRRFSTWCRQTNSTTKVAANPINFFATAGHTVLHEMTHLSSLAQIAGLMADENGSFATLDAQNPQKDPNLCELTGARDFLNQYNAGNTEGTSPDYNAESYAAAATDLWFSATCEFLMIPTNTS